MKGRTAVLQPLTGDEPRSGPQRLLENPDPGVGVESSPPRHCVTQETPSRQRQPNEPRVSVNVYWSETSGNMAQSCVCSYTDGIRQVSCITAKRQLNNTPVSSAESSVSAHPSVCMKQLIGGDHWLRRSRGHLLCRVTHREQRSHLNTNQTGPSGAGRGRNGRARGDCRLWLGNEKQLISEDARAAADS